MGFADLVRRQEAIEVGGRRYVCRPPTLVTLWLLFQHYSQEIHATATLAKKNPIDPAGGPALAFAWIIGNREGARTVLASCVSPAPAGEAIDPCLEVVIRLCDVERLARAIAADLKYASRGGDGALSMAVNVARALHADPFVVANEWPYEALLSIADELRDATANDSRAVKAAPGMPIVPGTVGAQRKKRSLLN